MAAPINNLTSDTQQWASTIEIPTALTKGLGSLSHLEACQIVPFEIKRVFFVHDWPRGVTRGTHAHRALWQLLAPMAGTFSIDVDDGARSETYNLDRPDRGLIVPPRLWTSITSTGSGNVLLCLASDHYREADYIRDYGDFLIFVGKE